MKLENWSVVTRDPYSPPEYGIYLAGSVYGHATRPDGQKITTSRIVEVNGRKVTTASGSIYEVGEVNPEYAKYLLEQGKPINPDNPIKLI